MFLIDWVGEEISREKGVKSCIYCRLGRCLFLSRVIAGVDMVLILDLKFDLSIVGLSVREGNLTEKGENKVMYLD